jgi:hypothetical protein
VLQSAPQFTPQQVLDSARRAEVDGRLELAAQLYRHLADYYPQTQEGAEARSGLARIGSASLPQTGRHGNGVSETRNGHAKVTPRRLPAPRNHYRTGLALAGLFSTLGWLGVVAGCAAPALLLVIRAPQPYGALGLVGGAAGLLVLGLLMVLAGQMVRALFDQANATRELVAIERARAAAD